ncbi:thioredoxin family protein [Fusibacter paucivorans]|uniref:Thioredoxin family protein n=1 Tax=Fusibacter paucivorans TaxID=76009 RepID=A0ABS5PR31_9FIRM|nr:thioredoxin family protein [Fusibacter paucivorans]MBS7527620.1 thioredoxin family protein [Fusibacter paucivorans]
MKLLNDDLRNQLKEVFQDMKDDVTIAVFTKSGTCNTCTETISFMEEIETLSDKIHLKKLDIENDAELAKAYDVQMVPSIVLLNKDEAYVGIKFNGIPAGHEINSFIPGILEVSGSGEQLPEGFLKQLETVKKPVNIKVFVTLSCPHCPGAVQKAHKLALENEFINAEMIEAQTFDEISNKFNVSSVPKIVINDQYEFVGNQPLEVFVEEIQKTQA